MAEELHLYYFPGSFYSQKGALALEEKGLQYHEHMVMLIYGEVYEPWYMRLNPNGTVPCLKHGEALVQDSQDIIHYLDDQFPDKPLIPKDPSFRAKVQDCQKQMDDIKIETLTYGSFANPDLTKNAKFPDFLAKKVSASMQVKVSDAYVNKLEGYAAAHPELRAAYERRLGILRGRVVEGYGDMSIPAAAVQDALGHATAVLRDMEAMLEANAQAGRPDAWLCGADFTEADLILGITLIRMDQIGFSYVWQDGSMPRLDKYLVRIWQRPSFSKYFSTSTAATVLLYMLFRHKAPYVAAGMKLAGAAVVVAGALATFRYLRG